MILRPQRGHWPAKIAPLGSVVEKAEIDRETGCLHLELSLSESGWSEEIVIPPPWIFLSCLLSLSSAQLDSAQAGRTCASELIGLEGARLSRIERDEKRLDLEFDSLLLSIDSSSAS